MKEKLTNLRAAIKTSLSEIETLINEGKFEDAKTKQAEIKTLQDQASVLAEQVKLADAEKVAALETENAELKTKLAAPARLPFEQPGQVDEEKPEDTPSGSTVLKYGNLEASIKAVIGDIYGKGFKYQEQRESQG